MDFLKKLGLMGAKPGVDERQLAEIATGMIEGELATWKMQEEAAANAGAGAMLTLAVPRPQKGIAGWFGGSPKLPKDVDWPEIDGTELCFVAQIDLTQVPTNIWSGVGPRHGHFAFFVHPNEAEATVLHVDGELEKREGPSPVGAHFWRDESCKLTPQSTHFTEWPVEVTGHVGKLPEPSGWRKGFAPNFPKPSVANEALDLTNKAHQPFDERSLKALLEGIQWHFEKTQELVANFLENKKLRPETSDALEGLHETLRASFSEFLKIREVLTPYTFAFDSNRLQHHLQALSTLRSGIFKYLDKDEEGYAEVEVTYAEAAEYIGFLGTLEREAKRAYVQNPEVLSAEVKARCEQLWAYDAIHERAAMSHPPHGFIYTPYGPTSPNEVLLELPSSDLIGWIWGDLYSIVLTIPREDLARGKYGIIFMSISRTRFSVSDRD